MNCLLQGSGCERGNLQCELKVSINFFVLGVFMQHVNFIFREDNLGRVGIKGWMEDDEKKQFPLFVLVQEKANLCVACKKLKKNHQIIAR